MYNYWVKLCKHDGHGSTDLKSKGQGYNIILCEVKEVICNDIVPQCSILFVMTVIWLG